MRETLTCLGQINAGMANLHSRYMFQDTCTTLNNNRTTTLSHSSTIIISQTWSSRSFNVLNPKFAILKPLSTSRKTRQIHSSSCRPRLIRAGALWQTPSSSSDGEKESEDSSTSGQSLEQEVVTEVHLSGDSTEVREIGDSLYSFKTLKKLVFKLGDGGKQFVMNSVGGVVGIFKMGGKKNKEEEEQSEMLAFTTSVCNTKDGISALHQWTATELTMQHGQLVRIATDLNYLVFAFAFFGWVRVLEAVLKAFATNPPKLRKLMQCSNAMDPLTVAWLAYNLRKPILGILQVDPTDFQKLATLKGKLWEELHAFFERQWKVVSFSLLFIFMKISDFAI